jgi:uncharacterized membrane protein
LIIPDIDDYPYNLTPPKRTANLDAKPIIDMELFASLLVKSHILAGASLLLNGFLAYLLRKGGKGHRLVGLIYFWSMAWIFISAILLISFVRFNFFLLVIGVFSFYLSFSGYRVIKRKKAGQETLIDWSAAIITMIAGIAIVVYGSLGYFRSGQIGPFVILCLFFGVFTFLTALADVRIFQQQEFQQKKWWMKHHLRAMSGSYIAGITAFSVQMGSRYLLHWDLNWLLWVLPAIIGFPIVRMLRKRYQARYGF